MGTSPGWGKMASQCCFGFEESPSGTKSENSFFQQTYINKNKKSIEERERAHVYRRRVGGQTSHFRRKIHSASIRLRWPTCIFKEDRNGYGNKTRVKEVGRIMQFFSF
jgi:hypothetical protein